MIPQAVETKKLELKKTVPNTLNYEGKDTKKIKKLKSISLPKGKEVAGSSWNPPLSLWLGYDFRMGESECPETQICTCVSFTQSPDFLVR